MDRKTIGTACAVVVAAVAFVGAVAVGIQYVTAQAQEATRAVERVEDVRRNVWDIEEQVSDLIEWRIGVDARLGRLESDVGQIKDNQTLILDILGEVRDRLPAPATDGIKPTRSPIARPGRAGGSQRASLGLVGSAPA